MNTAKLHVIIPYFNHTNARVNRRNLELCLRNLSINPDCRVVLVEGIWNREAELPDFSGKVFRHYKYRYPQALWVKENLINLALWDCGTDWEYAAWVDKDVEFTDPKWVSTAVRMLQDTDIIQPWSHVGYLDAAGERIETADYLRNITIPLMHDGKGMRSWCSVPSQMSAPCAHVGMAWAFTRSFMSRIGGLYDRCLFGGGDGFLTNAIKQDMLPFMQKIRKLHGELFDHYASLLQGARTGNVEGLILHHYHGEISKRFYLSRYEMAWENDFNPSRDVSYAVDGTIRLNNERMEEAIRDYFLKREEHLMP